MTFKAVYFPGDPLRKTEIQNAEFELNSLRDQGYMIHCCCPMATSTLVIMSRDNPLPVQEVAIPVDTQATKPSAAPAPSPEAPKPHPEHPEHPSLPEHPPHPEHPAHPPHPEHPAHPEHPQHPVHPEHPQHPTHPETPGIQSVVPPFTPNIVPPPPVIVPPVTPPGQHHGKRN